MAQSSSQVDASYPTVDETATTEAAPKTAADFYAERKGETEQTQPTKQKKTPDIWNAKRDGKYGWGKTYGTAMEALWDNMPELAPTLYKAYEEELSSGAAYTPVLSSVIAIGEDVRQEQISIGQALTYLEGVYRESGLEGIEKYYTQATGHAYDKASGKIRSVAAERNSDTEKGVSVSQSEKSLFGIDDTDDGVGVINKMFPKLKSIGFFDEGKDSRTVTNKESGMDVVIDYRSLKEAFGKNENYKYLSKSVKEKKIASIRLVPYVIENGTVTADNAPNEHKKNSSLRYAYIRGEITIDGKPYILELDIRKSKELNRFWVHRIKTKKVGDPSYEAKGETPIPTSPSGYAHGDTVPQAVPTVNNKISDSLYTDTSVGAAQPMRGEQVKTQNVAAACGGGPHPSASLTPSPKGKAKPTPPRYARHLSWRERQVACGQDKPLSQRRLAADSSPQRGAEEAKRNLTYPRRDAEGDFYKSSLLNLRMELYKPVDKLNMMCYSISRKRDCLR